MRRAVPALIVFLAACAGETTTTTTTIAVTTTPPPVTSTTAPTTTTTTAIGGQLTLPLALGQMPGEWEEALFISYGVTPETLGLDLVGDGEGLLWGPEYGAQLPDGTWWFLDVANFRLAHFSETGAYLGEVPVPESMLVNGVYFQWSYPRALDDGTFYAARLDLGRTAFLRLAGDRLDEFSVPYEMVPRADDGSIMYGFSFDETSALLAVDPSMGTAAPAEWMIARDGSRYSVTAGAEGFRIVLPDSSADVELKFEAAEIGGPVYVSVEVATGEDGIIHLFLLGFPERDERLQLAAYMQVSPAGEVIVMEPIINPFSESDPGTPARLGVRPGTSEVYFIHVGTDGVRIYVRS